MTEPLLLLCPAKVNLALAVGPPDGERGYHPIASWMVVLDWGDTLTLTPLDAAPSRFDIAFAPDAPQPQPVDWPLEKDLAFRAHRLLEAHAARPLPVHAEVRKRVPAGAGLAGGSSDAAAMLWGLNRLFRLCLAPAVLIALSRDLGSDVAFVLAALAGQPGAIVTGFGERIEPAPIAGPIHLVLVLPPLACPTAAVYRAFDARPAGPLQEDRVRRLAGAPTLDPAALFNDLAAPATLVTPALAEVRHQLRQAIGQPVHITGSGAALFAVAPSRDAAAALAARITRDTGYPAIAVQTLQAASISG